MRRRTVHAAFALASLAAAGALGWQLLALERAGAVNRTLASVIDAPRDRPLPRASDPQEEAPRVRLARASAFAARGDVAAAERLFTALARDHAGTPLGEAARFGLANRYLREGMREDLDPARVAPLLELAKQRYRDLLADRADDWDARYNLERALRLAPENEESASLDADDPVKSVDVVVPGFRQKDLP